MKVRSEIQATIEQIQPFDGLEEAHKEFTLKLIKSGTELFRIKKPATPSPHLVSYFLLIDEAANKILLVHHKKARMWLPSGGHVELNESPRVTVEREIVEELGIPATFAFDAPLFITVTDIIEPTGMHIDISLWYVLRGDSSKELNFDKGEFTSIRWFSPEEIPYKEADQNLGRFIEKLNMIMISKVAA